MRTGVVKNVNPRGFGFVTESHGGDDFFFHISALRDLEFDEQLKGRRVEFEIEPGRDGRSKCAWVRPQE